MKLDMTKENILLFPVYNEAEAIIAIDQCLAYSNGKKGRLIAIPLVGNELKGYVGFHLNENGEYNDFNLLDVRASFATTTKIT